MTVKVIIFDFDGTIADTLEVLVRITNRLAIGFGYQPISQEQLAQIRHLSSREIIKQSGVSIFKFPFLIAKVKGELRNEIKTLKPISGIDLALIDLKNSGYQLWILSSNSQENILEFLEINSLQKIFHSIYTDATIFGKSRVIKKLLKQANLQSEECVYIGDETRDIEAARRSKIKAIAVSWGFNTKEALATQNPDFLLDKPSDIITVIQSLQSTDLLQ